MRHSTTTVLLMAAFAVQEIISGPTLVHQHHRLHRKRDSPSVDWNTLDWNNLGIDWAATYAKDHPNSAAAPADPTPASNNSPAKVEPAEKIEPLPVLDLSNSAEPLSASAPRLWKNLVGASNNRRVFGLKTPTRGHEVGYLSNVGIPEGSNMIKVESSHTNAFTNEFINTSGKSMTVVIWNKAASPGLQDPLHADPNLGASIAPEHPALTIALAPGQSQVVAFMDESVIGWAEACDSRAFSGGFSTTWGEAQFNTTGSGYDVSAIQNPSGSTYKMHISSSEASSCDSTESENMWITDTRTTGSGSCYIAQNVAHLTTRMGGFAS